jgi:AmmeMemoRadiSam system protein A
MPFAARDVTIGSGLSTRKAEPKNQLTGMHMVVAFYPGWRLGYTYGGRFSKTNPWRDNRDSAVATYSLEEREFLLKTARTVITDALVTDPHPCKDETDTFPALREKHGCFVTLHKSGVLRGCIGTIEPVSTLIATVKDNALKAAFSDPRFPPVTTTELPKIEIEISVLTAPELLDYTDAEDLLRKLEPGVHGVILSQGWHSATFLPQVWTQLPRKEAFLSNLCAKAGLPEKAWQDKRTQIKVYEVAYFAESLNR